MILTSKRLSTLLLVMAIIFGASPAGAALDEDLPTTASDVKPLKRGDTAPAVQVQTPAGDNVKLSDIYSSAPTVLIFYRGGWCPYCNAQLGKLSMIEDELTSNGYQIVAISPDAPQFLQETAEQDRTSYMLLSDQTAAAARAFGLAFRVDDATVAKYLGYNINLEERAGGAKHHILPVPAAYVIDRDGKIRFAHWNADYTQRIDEQALLKAALKANKRY